MFYIRLYKICDNLLHTVMALSRTRGKWVFVLNLNCITLLWQNFRHFSRWDNKLIFWPELILKPHKKRKRNENIFIWTCIVYLQLSCSWSNYFRLIFGHFRCPVSDYGKGNMVQLCWSLKNYIYLDKETTINTKSKCEFRFHCILLGAFECCSLLLDAVVKKQGQNRRFSFIGLIY